MNPEISISELPIPCGSVNLPRCSNCLNYLSHGVAKMLRDGSPICDKCVPKVLPKDDVFESLFNLVSPHCQIKCKNYYSGCNQVIVSGSDHEAYCEEIIACCPMCVYVGNGSQMQQHFETTKPEFMVKEEFEIENKNGFVATFLYRNDEFMFSVYIVITNDVLKIRAINLFKNRNLSSYHIQLISNINETTYVYKTHGEFLEKKDVHKYVCIDLSKLVDFIRGPMIKCKITVDENISQKINEIRENSLTLDPMIEDMEKHYIFMKNKISTLKEKRDILASQNRVLEQSNTLEALKMFRQIALPCILTCTNCKCTLNGSFSICTKGHPVCSSCLSNICLKCEVVTEFKPINTLQDFELSCDWEGCDATPSFLQYYLHKQQCPHRLYNCPDRLCNFSATYNDFVQHWHYVIPKLELSDFVKYETPKIEFYWILPFNREFVYVKIKRINKTVIKIKVDERYMVCNQNYEIKLYCGKGLEFKYVGTLMQHGQFKILKYKHLQQCYKLDAKLLY